MLKFFCRGNFMRKEEHETDIEFIRDISSYYKKRGLDAKMQSMVEDVLFFEDPVECFLLAKTITNCTQSKAGKLLDKLGEVVCEHGDEFLNFNYAKYIAECDLFKHKNRVFMAGNEQLNTLFFYDVVLAHAKANLNPQVAEFVENNKLFYAEQLEKFEQAPEGVQAIKKQIDNANIELAKPTTEERE